MLQGKLRTECVLETKAGTIVNFIQALQGTLSLSGRVIRPGPVLGLQSQSVTMVFLFAALAQPDGSNGAWRIA
jgi:hypothetical protein